jgi:ABC-2 type transport system permease protein
MTAPVTEWDAILGKYFACIIVYLALLSPTLLYVPILRLILSDNTPLENAPIWAVYWIYLLWGLFYGAIGMLASSLTKSQVLALIISFSLSCVFFFSGFIIYFEPPEWLRLVGNYISAYLHLDLAAQGLLSSQSAVLYLSAALLLLLITQQVVLGRRCRS